MIYSIQTVFLGFACMALCGIGRRMTKFVKWFALLLSCFVLSGCPIARMLNDRLVYEFRGTIKSSSDHGIISSVKVIPSCDKSRLDPPLEVLSDDNGMFRLSGYFSGPLDDCQLSFEHPKFRKKILRLKPARELKADTGFMRIWEISVELEPYMQ
jgi:hypothetical protein